MLVRLLHSQLCAKANNIQKTPGILDTLREINGSRGVQLLVRSIAQRKRRNVLEMLVISKRLVTPNEIYKNKAESTEGSYNI